MATLGESHQGVTFSGEDIRLDGAAYRACVFRDCRMRYEGGPLPVLEGCDFVGCSWAFDGAAANTLLMLGALNQGGFAPVVEATLAAIRSGDVLATPAQPATAARSPGARVIDLGFGRFPVPRLRRRPVTGNGEGH